MTLLAQYLKTVAMYLPGKERADIIRELGENLQAEMDEREAELGRPLTEPEQQEFLLGHGNPMIVAGRYGGEHRTVSFGRQLIGPELFPLYIRVLLANWIISASGSTPLTKQMPGTSMSSATRSICRLARLLTSSVLSDASLSRSLTRSPA